MINPFSLGLFCAIAAVAAQSRDGVCDPACSGGPKDKCLACASHCVKTCDQPNGPDACIQSCNENACQCESPYVRGPNGECVLLDDCPNSRQSRETVEPGCTAKCTGGPHDKCTMCGTACPLTCDKPEIGPCTRQCMINVCQCQNGYVRDSRGKCIRKEQCPMKANA